MIVWDVERASAGETLEGHAGQVTGLAISRDGATLYTGGLDSKVADLGSRRRPPPRPPVRDPRTRPGSRATRCAPTAASSPIGHDDGTVALIDARTLRAALALPRHAAGPVAGHGLRAARPAARRRRRGRLPGPGGSAPRPDREAAAGSSRTGLHARLQRRRAADGRGRATSGDPDDGASACGAAVGRSRSARPLRYPHGRRHVAQPRRAHAGAHAARRRGRDRRRAHAAAPAPRCRSSESVLGFHALHARRALPHRRELEGLGAAVVRRDRHLQAASAAGSPATPDAWSGSPIGPDGRTLATGGPDGTIRLWDLRTQQPLGAPLPGLPNRASSRSSRPTAPTCSPSRRRRARLPLGRAPVLMGATRLRRGRPPADPDRVAGRAARTRIRAGLLSGSGATPEPSAPRSR